MDGRALRGWCAALLAILCGGLLVGPLTSPASAASKVLELSFDEGSGTVAADSSGRGNHGGISGAKWTQAGKYGRALAFEGDGDSVVVPDAPSLDLTGPMTMMGWYRLRGRPAYQTLLMKPKATEDAAYALYASDQGGGAPGVFSNQTVFWAPSSPPKNTWVHLASTFDGTTWRLFVDGAQVSSGAGPAPQATDRALTVGANAIWPGESLDGLVDEVRVYDGALTAAEIATARTTRIGSTTATSPSRDWPSRSTRGPGATRTTRRTETIAGSCRGRGGRRPRGGGGR